MKNKTTFRTLIILVLTMLTIVFIVPSPQVASAAEPEETAEINAASVVENGEAVFSYVTVFEDYYEQAQAEVEAKGGTMCSFDEFCDNYYESGMNIQDYTEAVISGSDDDIMPFFAQYDYVLKYSISYLEQLAASESGEGFTPKEVFNKEPKYNLFGYDLRNAGIQKGDIIIETRDEKTGIGHAGIVYDPEHEGFYGDDHFRYIQTIDALPGNTVLPDEGGYVALGYLDDDRMVRLGVEIYRVDTEEESIQQATEFCFRQLGKPYDREREYNRTDFRSESESWYSAELIVAAYWWGETIIEDALMGHNGVWPEELASSAWLSPVKSFTEKVLTIRIIGKVGSDWSIMVRNDSDQPVQLHYNQKMCFPDDASSWNLEKDVNKYVTIPKHDERLVTISENLFATTVAVSYVLKAVNDKDYRIITYASKLDKTNKTMAVRYKYIEI